MVVNASKSNIQKNFGNVIVKFVKVPITFCWSFYWESISGWKKLLIEFMT